MSKRIAQRDTPCFDVGVDMNLQLRWKPAARPSAQPADGAGSFSSLPRKQLFYRGGKILGFQRWMRFSET
jgi:hypothetical protein